MGRDAALEHIRRRAERRDATLYLPGGDITVTAVKVYEYPAAAGIILTTGELGLGHGYDIDDDSRLILRPLLFTSPFEGANASRLLRIYAKVEVYYEGTGITPRAVTEGVAFLAAGYWKDGPRALIGLTGEKIGDYSYTLGSGGAASQGGVAEYVAQAEWFLTPFLKRARVQVT